MTSLWLQSLLEWAFRQTYLTIQFFMLAGFLAALPRVLRHQRKQRQRARIHAHRLHALQQSRTAARVIHADSATQEPFNPYSN